MPLLSRKRGAADEGGPEKSSKNPRTGGRKILYDSVTELPSSPVHHQAILIDAVERSNHSKRGSDEEDKDEESKALKRVKPSKQAAKKTQEKRPLPESKFKAAQPSAPQQKAPQKVSLYFQYLRASAKKMLPKKDSRQTPFALLQASLAKKAEAAKLATAEQAENEPASSKPASLEAALSKPVSPGPAPTKPALPEIASSKAGSPDLAPSKPASSKPLPSEPAPSKPATLKPASSKAGSPQPALIKPGPSKLASVKPASVKPASAKAVPAKPTLSEPALPKSAPTKPAIPKPAAPKSHPRSQKKNVDRIRVPKRINAPPTAARPSEAGQATRISVATHDASVESIKKRKAEEPTEAPGAKKPANGKTRAKASQVPGTSAPVNGAPIDSPLKRRAEEHTEAPVAKKPAIGKPKYDCWPFTTKLPAATVKRVRVKETTIHTTGAIHKPTSKKCTQEGNVESSGPGVGGATSGSHEDTKSKSTNEQDQTSSDGVRPPSMMNFRNTCFANVMLQALHSIPEFRDYFVSKFRRCVDSEQAGRSISLSLGRLFEKMGAAVGKGAKVSAREFLRLFGNRHRGYDGYRSQQDTFEFWQKLLGELEAEETASGDTTTSIIALMKKLFAIKKLNRMECRACGHECESAIERTTSLQLQGGINGSQTTIEDCLKNAFAAETPEDYKCESCKKPGVTSKRECIQSCGPYLFLNFDRAGLADKLNTTIPIPEHVKLDELMPKNTASTSQMGRTLAKLYPDFRYEVVAFAEHYGTSRNEGHYIATRKLNNEWYRCNDLEISRVDRARDLQNTLVTFAFLKRCS